MSTSLAAFGDGDPRFIYAARRDGAPGLVHLPEGLASEFRNLARSVLRCPVSGCPHPAITTVGGERRHHFRHLRADPSTEHGPETWYHLEAKAVLAAWAKAQLPDATVEFEKVLGSGERVADLFVTLPDATKIAIEVQFSSLTPERFLERHQWYQGAGIVDVWLFIHAGIHLRTDWDRTVHVDYAPVHRAVANSCARALWINPQLRQIGYGVSHKTLAGRSWETHADKLGQFVTEPLEQLTLSSGSGLTSERLDALDTGTAAFELATAEAEEVRLAEERKRSEERVARSQATRKSSEEFAVDVAERAARREYIQAVWEKSAEADAALARFGGLVLPVWLTEDDGLDVAVPAVVWRWRLLRIVIFPLRDGEYVTSSLLARELGWSYPGKFTTSATDRELARFLRTLADAGLLARVPGQAGYYTNASGTPAVLPDWMTNSSSALRLCPACGLAMSPEMPWMTSHFGPCERRRDYAAKPRE